MESQDNNCNLDVSIKAAYLVSEEDYKKAMENGTIEDLFKNSFKVTINESESAINNIGVSIPYEPTFTIKL